MSDLKLGLTIAEENAGKFRKCIRRLLDSTFLVQAKPRDEKLYLFASRESNRKDISDYLRVIGYDIFVDKKAGICMLTAADGGGEEDGLKLANLVRFTPFQVHLLILLWKLYLENAEPGKRAFTEKGNLIEGMKAYGVPCSSNAELDNALHLFRKYSLIGFDEKDKGEKMQIELYGSLQFGFDTEQFRETAREYIEKDTVSSGEEDSAA